MNGGTSKWLKKIRENPNRKWMTGGTPYDSGNLHIHHGVTILELLCGFVLVTFQNSGLSDAKTRDVSGTITSFLMNKDGI
jgi:hypothetical protein